MNGRRKGAKLFDTRHESTRLGSVRQSSDTARFTANLRTRSRESAGGSFTPRICTTVCRRAIKLLREDSVARLLKFIASSARSILSRNSPCFARESIVEVFHKLHTLPTILECASMPCKKLCGPWTLERNLARRFSFYEAAVRELRPMVAAVPMRPSSDCAKQSTIFVNTTSSADTA